MFNKKNVKCTNCGFLCWDVLSRLDDYCAVIRHDELMDNFRDRLTLENNHGVFDDVVNEEYNKVACLRNQWIFSNVIVQDNKIRWANIESITNPRRCFYFVKYQPGFTPEEHKELQREDNTNRIVRNATLVGAVIGAGAAIAAQVGYALITNNR